MKTTRGNKAIFLLMTVLVASIATSADARGRRDRQVEIEPKVVETWRGQDRNLGIDWSSTGEVKARRAATHNQGQDCDEGGRNRKATVRTDGDKIPFLRIGRRQTRIETAESESEAKVPQLRNLPILGGMFGNGGRRQSRNGVLIVITPEISRSY